MGMHFLRRLFCVLALIGATFPAAASAEVIRKTPEGFVVRAAAEVSAAPEAAWLELIAPSGWWNPRHSFSGDASRLTLTPRIGGCFCEVLPQGAGALAPLGEGGVEHLRVIYVEPGRVIRLSGGLGPLQSEAANGVWTITLKAVGGKTRILFEYVVGGYMRYTTDEIAPVVDKILTEQLGHLAARFGAGKSSVPAQAPVIPAPKAVSETTQPPAPIQYSLPAQMPAVSKTAPHVAASPVPAVALSNPPASPRYVQRRFVVSRDARGFLLEEENGYERIRANFASSALSDTFRKAFDTRGASPLWCACMGSFAADGSAFTVIAAELDHGAASADGA